MAAFQEVYEEYARPVYGFLMKLSGQSELAEELLQETFYQAFLHIDRFEGRCSLYTWLCQIGKNAWLKELRRKKWYSKKAWEETERVDGGRTPEETAIERDEYRRARRAIGALEEPYRDVFILHAMGGVKLKEIAENYGKSESWARVTYFRARQRIAGEVLK